jgi:RHS repeat-associated protein
VALPASVGPGGQANFSFQITAPSTPGSYNFQWRMVQENVQWFGPFTPNVVVTVTAPAPAPSNGAQVVGVSAPSVMTQGQVYSVGVTMRNSGTTTWPAGSSYVLGSASPYNTMGWSMLQENVQWFGATSSTAVTVNPPASAPTVTYIHTDGLGSPVARTNAAGALISRTRYEPYGLTAGGATPTIGFTGHVNDADTGLVYMQQRYYDPVAGRFLSIDPVTTDANTGGSFNRYAYGNNSPYNYIDPDGRNGVAIGIIGGAVVWYIASTRYANDPAASAVVARVVQAIANSIGGNKPAAPKPGEVIQAPGNKPPFVGTPDTAVQAGTGSRSYGPDGYPETDRDTPHPDEAGVGSDDHSHDWGRPEGGGPPTHNDRGPPRPPKPGDPPAPRGPNVPPKDPPRTPPKEGS